MRIAWGDQPWLRPAPLVELFTTAEQRARTSVGYVRSAVGARLRLRELDEQDGVLLIQQHDEKSGLSVFTEITRVESTGRSAGWRVVQRIRNEGAAPIVLTAPVIASIGVGRSEADIARFDLTQADSEWLAEGRWRTAPLRDALPDLHLDAHGQDGRGRFARASRGGWSTGSSVPVGVLADRQDAGAIGWQIESSTGWVWEFTQGQDGALLALCGPTDAEHAFAHRLEPGTTFESVPVVVVVADGTRDDAFAALTRTRRATLQWTDVDRAQPIVYNDFMNTLMGNPSAERLHPLIDAASDAGADVFCMDAGWFAPLALGSDWWSTVGEWQEAADRYPGGGLADVCDRIRSTGMSAGLWLEPEVVGIDSPLAERLPDDAFLQRGGVRVREDRRYHLDFRHPSVRAHLDATVDRLVLEYGVTYLKLDYNIDPGPGTDVAADGPGDGLLGHARAYRGWLIGLRRRHPELLIENCASGAMRMDYALVGVVHQQSTSDQQDAAHYTPIAASAPACVLPEQAANWAYPSAGMTEGETVLTLANGLAGRLYLAGFLHDLAPWQRDLVHEAVQLHRGWRDDLARAVPVWPLGLPGWHDAVIALVLRDEERDLVVVWNRADAEVEVLLPGVRGAVEVTFPASASGCATASEDGMRVRLPAGPTARVLRVVREH